MPDPIVTETLDSAMETEVRGTGRGTTGSCPYPGLRAFYTKERDWYFGREAHVDAMLTSLETSRFLAVVGSSGSGKSSLVFAGLIPALKEGQLAGSRRDSDGQPAPWHIVSFNPGNDPLKELAGAIFFAAKNSEDPHLAGYIRAALDSGDHGLREALKVAGLLDKQHEILVYADQFEELFRFGEKSSRVAQENALRFARLLVAAADERELRVHLLLSMRSEFIGQCDSFSGLSELVSRSQFLTPRLTRKQLEQSLSCPAEVMGWKVAPDALAALLNDCGNSPDQLPLAQHILRRMWMAAAGQGRTELTLDDYTHAGGIRDSVAQHGDEILKHLPQPEGPDTPRPQIGTIGTESPGEEVARICFMALCEQRDEGPLVRRLSTREEIEALAGKHRALVATVIEAFGGLDPGFIREADGFLDVRHEAVLRQWPVVLKWRIREADAKTWLQDLSRAAKDLKEDPETERWGGNDLRGAEEWIKKAQPSETWARRHGVRNWEECLAFLDLSRNEAAQLEEREREEARQALAVKERYQRILINISGVVGVILLLFGVAMFYLYLQAQKSEKRTRDAINLLADTANDVTFPITEYAARPLSQIELQAPKLVNALTRASTEAPSDQTAMDELERARSDATTAADAIDTLAHSLESAVDIAKDKELKHKADLLRAEAEKVRQRRDAQRNPETLAIIKQAVEIRFDRIEQYLTGLHGVTLDRALVFSREADFAKAEAEVDALFAIDSAAGALGFEEDDFIELKARARPLSKLLDRAREIKEAATSTDQVTVWKKAMAVELKHGDKVNRVRFAPVPINNRALIASAGEDKTLRIWDTDGKALAERKISSPINDLAFNPQSNALAAASNGSTVRVFRWTGAPTSAAITETAFEKHSDSITDVEFSHGGERIVSASGDCTIRVFLFPSMEQFYFTSPPLPRVVTSVSFHSGNNIVLSGCDDGGVRLHTIIDQKEVRLLGTFDGAPARRPEFSPDGKLVIAASGDKTARVWQTFERSEIVRINHQAPVTHATFRPLVTGSGYTFVTTSTNGEIRLVQFSDLTTKSLDYPGNVLERSHPGAAVFATWSADGRWLATVGGGEVILWEWKNEALAARVRIEDVHRETSRAEFSPDARLLVTYGGDQFAYVWDLTKVPGAASP